MTIAIERPGLVVHQGHCLDVLRGMPDESVHAVVTSPPYYALRAYGTEPVVWGGAAGCAHEWQSQGARAKGGVGQNKGLINSESYRGSRDTDAQIGGPSATCTRCGAVKCELGQEPNPGLFVSHLVDIFREVRRVLRRDGLAFVNIADTYSGNRGNTAEKPGYDNKAAGNRGADIFIGRKETGIADKNLLLVPERLAIALSDDGWIVRSKIRWCKVACMPESVADRPTSAVEEILMLAKSPRYFYDAAAVAESTTGHEQGTRGVGEWNKLPSEQRNGRDGSTLHHKETTRNMRNYWLLSPAPFSAARLGVVGAEHYAAYPPELPRRCIAAATSDKGCCAACGAPWARVVERTALVVKEETTQRTKMATLNARDNTKRQFSGGFADAIHATTGWAPTCACADPRPPVPATVLDPFAGSGTTLATATKMGRSAVGIELNAAYLPIIAARNAQAGMGFFDDEGAAS